MTPSDQAPIQETPEQPALKKAITPKLLVLFIVGDILGTGVYALTGEVAGQVGGAGWLPIIIAFAIAMVSALSYVEMVTKYPHAAGAALYVHKAFGVHFLTFMVTFAVLSSGITSASTSSIFLAENVLAAFRLEDSLGEGPATVTATVIALAFLGLVACINLYGVSESVKANVALTLIELTGLMVVMLVGFYAIGRGQADFSRVILFETPGEKGLFMAVIGATALAFFSMVGFEDSVNMAEETVDPVKNFPRALIGGLSIRCDLRADLDHRRRGGPDRPAHRGTHPAADRGRGRSARHPDPDHLRVHLDLRGGQYRADQHDDGLTPAVRHVQAGGPARLPQGCAQDPPHPVRRDPVLHAAGRDAGADRQHRPARGDHRRPRGHHGAAAADGVRAGQHLRPGATRGAGPGGPLPHADRPARDRRAHLFRPGLPPGPAHRELRDRGRSAGHRSAAVRGHLDLQPGDPGPSHPVPPPRGPRS